MVRLSRAKAFLPFGGIRVNVLPGYASELRLDGLFRADEADLPKDPGQRRRVYEELLADYSELDESFRETDEFPGEYLVQIETHKRSTVVVAGRLVGPASVPEESETVDVVLTDARGKVWPVSGEADSGGSFCIHVGDAALGKGSVMLYYFGPQMAASLHGPVDVTVP